MKTLTVNGEQRNVKEMSDWTGDFTEQFKPGDLVTEEIAWYFLEVLPPHTQSFGYFQVGEPHSHINGRPTWSTFEKVQDDPEVWEWRGLCFTGERNDYRSIGEAK